MLAVALGIAIMAIALLLVFFNAYSNKENTTYIGLSEQAALNKAKSHDKSARVIKRNGEPLPVTMDYSPGRINLIINNNVVEKVIIEGE